MLWVLIRIASPLMSTHNIGIYEDLTKHNFKLSSNIMKYAPYLFFCNIIITIIHFNEMYQNSVSMIILYTLKHNYPLLLCYCFIYNMLQPTDCGPLTNQSNGYVSFSTTTYESEATYGCDPGYSLNGTTTQTCQEDATWSNSAPFCQIKGVKFVHTFLLSQ